MDNMYGTHYYLGVTRHSPQYIKVTYYVGSEEIFSVLYYVEYCIVNNSKISNSADELQRIFLYLQKLTEFFLSKPGYLLNREMCYDFDASLMTITEKYLVNYAYNSWYASLNFFSNLPYQKFAVSHIKYTYLVFFS